MATITQWSQYWTPPSPGLAPGEPFWLSYGPDDIYLKGSVQVMAVPNTAIDGTVHRQQTLSVPEVFITIVPHVQGDLVFHSAYTGFNIYNRGQNTVKHFWLYITVIGP
jgi:hypothetical protein